MEENKLRIKDLAIFCCEDIPQKEQIITGGILPQNAIALIGGIAKQGKSIFALNMGIQIASGKPFLERFNIPNPKRVLYLQSEISPQSMQSRSGKMLRAIEYGLLPQRCFLINERGVKIDRTKDLELLNKTLADNAIEVLILDPLYKFHKGDENKVSDMTNVFDRLDWLVQQNNISVVVVHHFGKPNENRSGATRFRGSSTIIDYADTYMMLTRHNKEDRHLVKLSFELRNDDEPEPMILYRNPETLWYEVQGVESDRKITVKDVVDCLRDIGGSTSKRESLIDALIDKKGASKRLVSDVLIDSVKTQAVLTVGMKGRGNPKLYYLPEMESKIRQEMIESPGLFSANAFSAETPCTK